MKFLQNDIHLTKVELEILSYIKKGFSSPEIARLRKCSTRTIEKHRSNLIEKLNLSSSQNSLLIWVFQNPEIFTT